MLRNRLLDAVTAFVNRTRKKPAELIVRVARVVMVSVRVGRNRYVGHATRPREFAPAYLVILMTGFVRKIAREYAEPYMHSICVKLPK